MVPTWIATWKLLLDCCAQKLQEERVRAIFDEEKSFSVPVWFSTSRLVPYCFAQILQEKKGCKEEDFSNPSGKKKGCSTNSTTIFDYF